ncbi:MAG: NADH:flavin oxidoreductase/NADH oxidase, partial [Arcanobacterium sp.]|nr:NADH:flavin oxidoreductase/NADH oxidase [Arcanobacterium sp.]
MTSPVFEPLSVRSMTTRNRLWIPPMCQYSAFAADGLPTPYHVSHYGALARGGAGAVIVEMTNIVPEGRISPNCLGLWSQAHTEAFKPVVAAIKAGGAKAGIQIGHAGRKASTAAWIASNAGESLTVAEGGWNTIAPSALAFPGLKDPRELELSEIQKIISDFADAAQRAVYAGFDFIEIHGAHGYLLTQFFSPLSNQRTDSYGGPLENRARLSLEVVNAIRAVIPEDMPLVYRISATEWLEGGITVEDSVQLLTWVKELGVDIADVSTGGNMPASFPIYAGYQIPSAAKIKTETGLITGGVGLINEPRLAEYLIGSEEVDFVLIG